MKSLRPALCLACSFLVVAVSQAAAADLPKWETNLETAIQRTKDENKDLLVAFRGPSINPRCKEFNEKIFDSRDFRTVMGHKYVLFHVLDPLDQDEEAKKAYPERFKRFRIKRYPVTLLCDPELRIYGQTNEQRSDSKTFIGAVSELGSRKAILEEVLKAAENEGKDAKLLSDKLEALGAAFVIQYHPELVEQVIQWDVGNQLGVAEKWSKLRYQLTTLQDFNQIWVSLTIPLAEKKTASEQIAVIDGAIKERAVTDPRMLQLFEMRKFLIWGGEKNYSKMLEVGAKAHELAPETGAGKQILKLLEQVKKLKARSESEPSTAPSETDAPESPTKGEQPAPSEDPPGKKK